MSSALTACRCSDGRRVNRYPMNRTSGHPAGPSCDGGEEHRPECWKFSTNVEGDPKKLRVRHMTVIG